jgi:cold shock CspA family protein
MFGTCTFYDRRKAWGWILPDDTHLADFFVHVSALPKNHRFLNIRDRVEFNAGEHNGKSCAIDVKILSFGGVAPSSGESQSLHKMTANPNPQDESRMARQIGEARAAERRSVSTVRPGEAWSSDSAEGERS